MKFDEFVEAISFLEDFDVLVGPARGSVALEHDPVDVVSSAGEGENPWKTTVNLLGRDTPVPDVTPKEPRATTALYTHQLLLLALIRDHPYEALRFLLDVGKTKYD